MTYKAEYPQGSSVQDLIEFLNRELQRIEDGINTIVSVDFQQSNAEPSRPREAQVYYADGTNWNPGGGEGLYVYVNSQWEQLNGNDVKFQLDLAKGNIANHSVILQHAHDHEVSAIEADIWQGTGNLVWQTAAESLYVAPGSAADALSATGAWDLVIEGLDADFSAVSETINLKGASTSSLSVNTYIRLNRAYVSRAGTYGGTNMGNLTVSTNSGNPLAVIIGGYGESFGSHYTVPVGHTAYIVGARANVESLKPCDVSLYQRQNASASSADASTAKRIIYHWEGIIDAVEKEFKAFRVIPAKTDLWMTGSKSSAGTAEVVTDYEFILVKN